MRSFLENETAIEEAYWYLLTRGLVIRQEINDIKKTPYNTISHKKIDLDDISFVNPNFDVVYSDAWLAIDEKHAVIINVPEIQGRYYTVQLMNGWGETIGNINNRNYPKKSFGKFALVLKGSKPSVPFDATIVELDVRKIKVLIRVEIKGNLAEAMELQKQFTLDASKGIKIEMPPAISNFQNDKLIGADIFLKAKEIIESCPDKFLNADKFQKDALKIRESIENSPENRKELDALIEKSIIPNFFKLTASFRTVKDGWYSGYVDKNNTDNLTRLMINYIGLWANIGEEVVYFLGFVDSDGNPLNGSNSYSIRFPADELPDKLVKSYWSITALSLPDYLILPNDLNKYSINNMLDFKYDDDGSLTLWLSSKKPDETIEANWMPIIEGKPFNLNFRLYVPIDKVLSPEFFPAPILKKQ